ncbi:MAG: hypothetical protein ACI4NN_06165 [Pyramidobacter sp.]|jgi:hypothetical protein
MPETSSVQEKKGTLRWFCGVPVFANPLILTDLFSALVILWFMTVLLMALAQLLLGTGPLLPSHLTAASIFAGYLVLFSLIIYTAVVLIFYPHGYVMLFRFEDSGIYIESLRGRTGGRLFRTRPFAVGPSFTPRRSVVRNVSWADVRGVRELADMNVIILKKRGTLARIYCPDKAVYEAALRFIRKKAVCHV